MNNLNEIELNVRDRVQLENLHISTVAQGGGSDVVPIEVVYDDDMGSDILQCTPKEMKALVDENKSIVIYSKWGNFEQPNSFWGYEVLIFLSFNKNIAPITGAITYTVSALSYATGNAQLITFASNDLDNKFVHVNLT